ncbi:MAG: cell division protein ZapE [Micavibrio sp.]
MIESYHALIAQNDIAADEAQARAARSLQRLQDELAANEKRFFKKKKIRGVYIYGGVGRGKSMLMDLFFEALPPHMLGRRIHFHEFLIETHDWLHQRRAGKAVDNLLPAYAAFVAKNVRVLCFDEFHVTDVADAMILSRLFAALFDLGVVVVATSNWIPDRLYEGGLQRVRFLPFIALVKERMEVVHLDSPTDYRKEALLDLETYLHPLDARAREKADRFFIQLSGGEAVREDVLTVKGRSIPVRSAGGAARFTFAQLCEQPYGAEDYLLIAETYHTVFLENIPRMGYDRNNEAKRLMTLVDVLYDARRRAVFTAEAAPDKIYTDTKYAYEFERTISRLQEMQSSSYPGE